MPEFAYIARDLTGNRVEGTLAAGNEREAVATLSGKRSVSAEGGIRRWPRRTGAKSLAEVQARIMAGTYGQLSALLGSGVPLLRSLELLREQTPHKNLAIVLEDVHSRVQEGATLADAMPGIRERSANWPPASSEPAAKAVFSKKRSTGWPSSPNNKMSSKGRVIGALAYPAISVRTGHDRRQRADYFLRAEVRTIYSLGLRNRANCPLVTDWLLWLSDFMQSYGIFIAAGLVVRRA